MRLLNRLRLNGGFCSARPSILNAIPVAALILPLVYVPLFAAEVDRDLMGKKIERLVQQFSDRLGITQNIRVSIEPGNVRLASAESTPGENNKYRMSFNEDFLRNLNEAELGAAVAHEMGHVWIYTHFPYLQTESLANRQALKLVPREALERVYQKVRKWNGVEGPPLDLPRDPRVGDSRQGMK